MKIRSTEYIAIFILAGASCRGQIISTFAGDDVPNTSCSKADGIPATSACMQPSGIAMDKAGNVYLSDGQFTKIRKINTSGIITTIAGTTYGFSGDGGPAISAQLTLQGGSPGFSGLAVDGAGNVYISDTHNCVIRLITAATGIITTVAGNHTCGFAGESGLATAASLLYPTGITLDSAGNLYIADTLNNRVRKVDSSGMISTVAGNGDATYDGDNVQATTTGVVSPEGLTFDSAGNLYISESDRIRKVDTSGTITTIAGKTTAVQTPGFSGDGGLATAATLSGPLGLVVDSSGNLYFGDNQNLKVRRINTAGIISTYAGVFGPVSTPLGNGGPATSAYIGNPLGLLLDAAGDLLITTTTGDVRDVKAAPPAPPTLGSGGVVGASAFGKSTSIAPGSWIEIYGSSLASNTRQWATTDFSGVNAPTSLDGTSVTIGGQQAFIAFISPGQVNAQVPSNVSTGVQQVALKSGGGTSASLSIMVSALEPGLLAPASFNIGGVQYVVALFLDGTYVLPEGAIAGVNSRPAKPGDVIVLYGVGFGPVTPAVPAGQIVQQSNTIASNFQMSIGGTSAKADYSGLAPNYVGLYQFNIVVPAVAASNAAPLTFTLGGTNGTQTLYIAIGN
ncbi:MAG TPA: hypothetical protein VK686_00020 [Bryobacteraceae bacterium]|nr:hypothetical protein [Bryobacteraceae bacterium]